MIKTIYIKDLPPHIIESEDVSEEAKVLLGYLLYYFARSEAKDTGIIIVSRDMMCERTGLSKSAVNGAKLELKDFGLLDYENGKKRQKGQASIAGKYYLKIDNILNESYGLKKRPSYLLLKNLVNHEPAVMVNEKVNISENVSIKEKVNENVIVNVNGNINKNEKENIKEKKNENRNGNETINKIGNIPSNKLSNTELYQAAHLGLITEEKNWLTQEEYQSVLNEIDRSNEANSSRWKEVPFEVK